MYFQKGKTMKKKKTKLFSWTVASVAALTLLCGTWASAAVSLTSGADGIYLRNSGKEYTFQVDVPKNHFVAIRVDGIYLMGEKAPVQIDIEVGGTAPVVTPAPETQAPSSTKTPTPAATTAIPSYAPPEPSEAPTPSESPVNPSYVPEPTSGSIVSTGAKSAVSELPSQSNAIEALVKLAAPAEANAETYYATIRSSGILSGYPVRRQPHGCHGFRRRQRQHHHYRYLRCFHAYERQSFHRRYHPCTSLRAACSRKCLCSGISG